MLYNYSNLVYSSCFREKLYSGLSHFNSKNSLLSCWSVHEVKLVFLLSNLSINKTIFTALLLLLEKLTLNTFSFIISHKTIATFNIKKNLRIGAVFTLRNFRKDQFLKSFINYSIKKLNKHSIFYKRVNGSLKVSFESDLVSFGLQKVLFNHLISFNNEDYQLLSPLFENMTYGVNIYFFSFFRNYFINRLILSQYGITII
jgi:ribosomal protein L5